jgi:hypothetical protein
MTGPVQLWHLIGTWVISGPVELFTGPAELGAPLTQRNEVEAKPRKRSETDLCLNNIIVTRSYSHINLCLYSLKPGVVPVIF